MVNNNNYNLNFINGSRLDWNRYYSRNKNNIFYNIIGKNIFVSQENLVFLCRKEKNGLNKNKSKKSSSKKKL